MEKKNIELKKENIKIENEKVIITSQELANLIDDEDFQITSDEEAGITINVCGNSGCTK